MLGNREKRMLFCSLPHYEHVAAFHHHQILFVPSTITATNTTATTFAILTRIAFANAILTMSTYTPPVNPCNRAHRSSLPPKHTRIYMPLLPVVVTSRVRGAFALLDVITPHPLRSCISSRSNNFNCNNHRPSTRASFSTTNSAKSGTPGILAEAFSASVKPPTTVAQSPEDYETKPHRVQGGKVGFVNPWDSWVSGVHEGDYAARQPTQPYARLINRFASAD
ncbi:hypothetical protein FN846DRAFT_359881 [Sphaerosporella brunnea]|uniref:Uncharacterized protein n=1 Tax=Sphaerosporella brunnea TaxID=1250544 RepID=A0A5J5F6T6_9PEZI|nr:hypothetical protein FN846DRAFT_359881 [Sphaerosporella brunnea]